LPHVKLRHSPLAGGPAEIYYRDYGSGLPLVFLHGGWGYEIYPVDVQWPALENSRVLTPDRSGYGRSTKPAIFGADFHHRAVTETLHFLDALALEKCIFWGHSDGAVIAALLGIAAPQRCLGLVLEAFHYDRAKPHSRKFFEDMAADPESFGTRVAEVLRREHGEPYWKELIRSEGQTWLDIARAAESGPVDLFDKKLSRLRVPTVFLHGAEDPRTEPGELDHVRCELPAATFHVISRGGHSPHSESASAAEFERALGKAVREWSRAEIKDGTR